VEGLEMRLGEERDHRDPLAAQKPPHLPEMAEARDRRLPTTGLLLAPHGRRQITEEHLVDADREVRLEAPGKEVELRRAAVPEEDRHGPLDGGGQDAGEAQNAPRP